MAKQAVKVIIRARPTANFASKNIIVDGLAGVILNKFMMQTIGVNVDKKDEGAVNN